MNSNESRDSTNQKMIYRGGDSLGTGSNMREPSDCRKKPLRNEIFISRRVSAVPILVIYPIIVAGLVGEHTVTPGDCMRQTAPK